MENTSKQIIGSPIISRIWRRQSSKRKRQSLFMNGKKAGNTFEWSIKALKERFLAAHRKFAQKSLYLQYKMGGISKQIVG